MALREWPLLAIAGSWLVWFVVGTALFWGSALLALWRARHSGDTIFVVAHGSAWVGAARAHFIRPTHLVV
jgi:hypothetical protein